MRLINWVGRAALLALCVSSAQAAEGEGAQIARAGNGKGADACSTCHGMDGAGMAVAGFPRLAGQNADYLAKQLRDMQQGLRSNPVMQPMAKALSDSEIVAVARFFAGLPVTPAQDRAPSDDVLKKGEHLAKIGNWSKGVPACFQCHGAQGAGVATHFPSIAPQSASYMLSQLKNWKNGSRHNDPQGLMKTVAERLTDDEMSAVAAYLASLGPR
ncbi:MAG: c-type cytochrome [Thiobacillus sp.]